MDLYTLNVFLGIIFLNITFLSIYQTKSFLKPPLLFWVFLPLSTLGISFLTILFFDFFYFYRSKTAIIILQGLTLLLLVYSIPLNGLFINKSLLIYLIIKPNSLLLYFSKGVYSILISKYKLLSNFFLQTSLIYYYQSFITKFCLISNSLELYYIFKRTSYLLQIYKILLGVFFFVRVSKYSYKGFFKVSITLKDLICFLVSIVFSVFKVILINSLYLRYQALIISLLVFK